MCDVNVMCCPVSTFPYRCKGYAENKQRSGTNVSGFLLFVWLSGLAVLGCVWESGGVSARQHFLPNLNPQRYRGVPWAPSPLMSCSHIIRVVLCCLVLQGLNPKMTQKIIIIIRYPQTCVYPHVCLGIDNVSGKAPLPGQRIW